METIRMTDKHTAVNRRRRRLLNAGLAIGGALATPAGFAQGKYPSRPMRMIVPSPPGGGPDIVGRLVAQHLTQRWGQQVLIENIGGASGQVGILTVTKAPADGYTLAFSAPTPITIGDNFEPKPPYNAQRELVGAALIGRNPALIVINSQLKANNLREFIALAKAEPKKINMSSPGIGNALHLIAEILSVQAGIQMTHVPYKGSGPAVVGLLANDVQFLVQSAEAVKQHVQSGRLRALATLESTRLEAFPNVPTLAEAGLTNLNIMNWYGVFLPSATPKEIVETWEKELLSIAKDPGFIKRMHEMSFDPVAFGTQEFARMMAAERPQWTAAIKAAGIDTKKN
jgi:tripartite-type tricarboxylate transporter receptor subunit TctC